MPGAEATTPSANVAPLKGRRCAACKRLSIAAGRSCPFCGSEGWTEVPLSGAGRLVTFTVIRVAPARYAAEAPYAVGVIELPEGARLTARIEGDPERLTLGQPLTFARFDEARGPIFRA